MPFIIFIAGENKAGKLLSVAMGIAATPEELRASLAPASPFELRVLGVEPGSDDRLRELQDQFAPNLMKGIWYRPEELAKYAEALPPLDAKGSTKRVSLDLDPADFADLEVFCQEKGVKTKSNMLRRALRFYRALHRYQAQGYVVQAIKNGKLVQFPDLDDIR